MVGEDGRGELGEEPVGRPEVGEDVSVEISLGEEDGALNGEQVAGVGGVVGVVELVGQGKVVCAWILVVGLAFVGRDGEGDIYLEGSP